MKKIFPSVFFLISFITSYAQVLNQLANWPNTNWAVTGVYNTDPGAFEADPTTTSNFAFDDDDAGAGSDDDIAAESPVIDLTAASNASETWLFVDADYTYNDLADTLTLEYWDADTAVWVAWQQFVGTADQPFDDFCSGLRDSFQSEPLNILAFTATQLTGFKYRISFLDDGGAGGDAYEWGFCFDSPTISSQTPPACLDLSDLTAAVNMTTVNLGWTAQGAEMAWEVVNQAAGSGVPSGSGTPVTTNPYEISGLTEGTDYEFYVRANCESNGFSNWVGPFEYSISGPGEVCENPIMIPSALPYTTNDDTLNYGDDYDGGAGEDCGSGFSYLGGEDVVYSYTATTDTSINIELSNLTDNYAGVFIYDSCANIGIQCISGAVNGFSSENLEIPEFTVTNGVTYYIVISTWPAPQSVGYTLTISENTCINQEATFTVVEDCDTGDQFNLAIDITNLGDATQINISDDQGNTDTATAPGIVTLGPYPNGTNVIITLENNDDANCILTSETLTQAACPPDNDLCENATTIVCGDTATGNTSAASDTGAPSDACGTTSGAPGVWYVLEGDDSFVTASLCGSDYDSKIQIYEGSCAALTCITGEDDDFDNCGDTNPQVEFVANSGTTYYIYVFGFGAGVGNYNLELTCIEIPDPPVNDECENAIVATVNSDSNCDILNPGSIISASASSAVAGSCNGIPNDDVWFEFTALDAFQLISINNIEGATNNLDHAVYEGSCDALTELYCSDETASITPELTVGSTYYIRIFSAGTDTIGSNFDLCINKAPENTTCENASNFCSAGEALVGSNIIGLPNDTSVACLGTIPNPSWNIIQVGEPGTVEIQITQNTEFDMDGNPIGDELDVDFVLWGPFDAETNFCELDLLVDCPSCPFDNEGNEDFYPFGDIVDCSYSPDAVENITIENALGGELYVLLVTNFSDDPGTIQIIQTNEGDPDSGSITAEIEVDLGDDEALCGFPDYTINADSPFADAFEWFKDGVLIDGETGDSITVTESGTYSVSATDTQCDATAEDTVIVTFYTDANANPADAIITCDDLTADDIEDFNLEAQTPVILGTQDPDAFVITYYLSLSDAQTETGALTSPYTNISNPQTIFARIEDTNAVGSNSGCFATTSFDLVITGTIPSATAEDFEICDDVSGDGIEVFDLDSHSPAILDGQDNTIFSVTYYATQTDADAGTSPLTSLYENTSNPEIIYARVDSNQAVDCYATTAFNLKLTELPLTSFESTDDFEVCPNATVPINIVAVPENYLEADASISWYKDGVLIAGENTLTLPVLTQGEYSIEVTDAASGCPGINFVTIIELENCVIPSGISPNGDDKNQSFDLSSYNVQLLEIFSRNGTRVYSKKNYTNEWEGQSDKGDKLPVGTYFYVMYYDNGLEKADWVYVNY